MLFLDRQLISKTTESVQVIDLINSQNNLGGKQPLKVI